MEKELPKSWIETEVKVLSYLIRGVSYKKADAKSTKEKDDYLILRGGNIQDGVIVDNEGEVYVNGSFVNENQKIHKGDVVIVGSTGSKKLIGKAGIAKKDYENVSFGAFLMVIRPVKGINASFFDYYFLSDNYREKIRELAGGININNIRKEYIEGLKFPLPPLPEQIRIVAKLDTLFEQLEGINTSLERIPGLLKNFRQQVLTQAVTGKLTEEWRKGKEVDKWKKLKVKQFTSKVGSGSTPRGGSEAYKSSGIPLIRSMNIHFSGIKKKGLAFIDEGQGARLKNVIVEENDVLLNITGASIGRVCLAPQEFHGARVNQHVSIIRPKKPVSPEFLNFYFASNVIQDFIFKENYGVTRQALTKTQLLNMEVLVPSEEEQKEIVRRLKGFFVKADAIELQFESLKSKVNSLPQTILQKAFKGELVPQLESDGDARELLEEIRNTTESLVQKASVRKMLMKNINKTLSSEYPVDHESINTAAESGSSYSNKNK
ncbi:restriction endonuclease subunit S [Salinimicrobium sp. MT39]|uniref:Restriction endonuclease subunit S n=1 Tax=Salinimicrobium profundisediminis TaxID=2994553 RepID=A0A9X3I0I7_9FLAO|nr:restriction endonuclease subunit S [Salinimicrobium profundisediminis]MCX2837876.1 restriction endonuclease subunit S [Salinimicrobium profundisediminis]